MVVFLRGINVGGYRRFRPSVLAKQLSAYDVVNVGAAGTLVVRKPGSRAEFLARLRRKLPQGAVFAVCSGRDLIRLAYENPFRSQSPHPDQIPFVSILSRAARPNASLPFSIPDFGQWFVRVMGFQNRLIFGVYRRRMKSITYLGQLDRLFGAPTTTRHWHTILSVVRILEG